MFVLSSPRYPTVNIRHYWKPDNVQEHAPTKKVVTLIKNRFARLRHAIEEMHGYMYVPELKEVELCMLSKSHRNQLGMLNCLECTPFSYYPQANL